VSFTVLLTSTGGTLSAQVIRWLRASRRHRIRVVAVDARDTAVGRHFADAFHRVPMGDDPRYVARIGEIIRQEKVDLILPCSDEEALALADQRAAVETESCQLACAPAEMLRLMSDKNQCYTYLRKHGVATPDWACAHSRSALEAAVAEFAERGEFALKPMRSRGNRDIYVIRRDEGEVEKSLSGRELHMGLDTFRRQYLPALAERLPFMVMERLLPPAYDVDVLSWQGVPLRIVPRRRLNTEGVPFLGNVIVGSAELVELGQRIAGIVGLSWLYDFDIMTSRSGTPAVLELNPRPSGSFAASVAAGIPLLDDLVSLAKGEALPATMLPEEKLILPYTALEAIP